MYKLGLERHKSLTYGVRKLEICILAKLIQTESKNELLLETRICYCKTALKVSRKANSHLKQPRVN